MKKLFFTIALLFSFVFVFAQESSYTGISADEGIIGFYGIPFGTNKETVIKMIKKKDGQKVHPELTKNLGITLVLSVAHMHLRKFLDLIN